MATVYREDLKGRTFGRLTVVRRGDNYVSPKGDTRIRWLCKCSCGNPELTLVNANYLKDGTTKSCGCLAREMPAMNREKYMRSNEFEVFSDHVIGYTRKGHPFIIDLDDYEKVKEHCWHSEHGGYITSYFDGNHVKLHRFVMGVNDSEVIVDHINHQPSDNRKCNLRITNAKGNARNSGLNANNTSGVTGVGFRKQTGRWYAAITVGRVRHNLGTFDRFEDAVKARKEAEALYFREYSYDYSMKLAESVTI